MPGYENMPEDMRKRMENGWWKYLGYKYINVGEQVLLKILECFMEKNLTYININNKFLLIHYISINVSVNIFGV